MVSFVGVPSGFPVVSLAVPSWVDSWWKAGVTQPVPWKVQHAASSQRGFSMSSAAALGGCAMSSATSPQNSFLGNFVDTQQEASSWQPKPAVVCPPAFDLWLWTSSVQRQPREFLCHPVGCNHTFPNKGWTPQPWGAPLPFQVCSFFCYSPSALGNFLTFPFIPTV